MTCSIVHFDGQCKQIGSGRRIVFTVGNKGRKWVKIFYPAGMAFARVALSDYETAVIRECTPKEKRRVLKMMKRTVKEYDNLDLQYSKKAVKEIRKEH